jgi:hypothetical protein
MGLSFSRRQFLAASGAAAAGPLTSNAANSKPNFIFFMPETLRAESIGCYGHPLVRTPNLDRLAAEGTRFAQCHVQNTVCGPAGAGDLAVCQSLKESHCGNGRGQDPPPH